MSYLETGVLVEADDSEDDKACSNRERKSDHGKLAVVSCEQQMSTMAIDVHKQSSMNSHSRASHFLLLQPLFAWTLCTQEQTTAIVNHDSQNSAGHHPLSCTFIWWQWRSGLWDRERILEKMNCNREVVPMSRGKHGMDSTLLSSCFSARLSTGEK